MLAKGLETISWVFETENKIVNIPTDNGSNFAIVFNVYGEMGKTVEKESFDEKRSICSSGSDNKDTTQPGPK